MEWQWDWALVGHILPELARAFRVTIAATVFGFSLALVGGLLLTILRRSRWKIISWPAHFTVEFIRSTPLLVQLFFIYFVLPIQLPDFGGMFTSAFVTGVLALGLHYSSYTSEVYRAGIDGVPKGQWEAAAALNMSRGRTWTSVVLPQAIPPVLPALGNYLIAMFKDTPLLYAISVAEVLTAAYQIGSQRFQYVEAFTIVGALFLIVSLISAWLIRRMERWTALPAQ